MGFKPSRHCFASCRPAVVSVRLPSQSHRIHGWHGAPASRARLRWHRCTGGHTSRPSSTAGAAYAGWGCRTSCMSPALIDPCTPYPLFNHIGSTPSSIYALYPLAGKPRRSSALGPDSARPAPCWAHRAVVNAPGHAPRVGPRPFPTSCPCQRPRRMGPAGLRTPGQEPRRDGSRGNQHNELGVFWTLRADGPVNCRDLQRRWP